MAVHFNALPDNLVAIKCVVIEQVIVDNGDDLDTKLLAREAYWTAQLFALKPHGINKRNELRSINRIDYYNKEF